MRILHVLDHSLPLHSGYAFRTAAILREQRALGYETFHLTTPRHRAAATGAWTPREASAASETAAGLNFVRTPFTAGWRSTAQASLGQPASRTCREPPMPTPITTLSSCT